MSALYIHIPFCKQACHYCDFHFSTNFSKKSLLVDAICKEIFLQKDYLQNKQLKSIYFGGGTPSVLSEKELTQIFDTIYTYFSVEKTAEITFEANPDDIFKENLNIWQSVGINRLSVGVQSFHDEFLKWSNRNHDAQQAENCIKNAQDAGFEQISLDLMYGFPADNHHIWQKDLHTAILLNVPHISAYCLTIEKKTTFGKWLKQGKIKAIDDDFSAQQLEMLMDFLIKQGYLHYEISNFCKPDQHAKHNSNYWLGGEYLGIGASAHSYSGFLAEETSRQCNISNNALYTKSILENDEVPFEKEILTNQDKYNEYFLTNIRTHWGVDLEKIKSNFGEFWGDEKIKFLEIYKKNECITQHDNMIYLTRKGKMIADVITELFFV